MNERLQIYIRSLGGVAEKKDSLSCFCPKPFFVGGANQINVKTVTSSLLRHFYYGRLLFVKNKT